MALVIRDGRHCAASGRHIAERSHGPPYRIRSTMTPTELASNFACQLGGDPRGDSRAKGPRFVREIARRLWGKRGSPWHFTSAQIVEIERYVLSGKRP